MVRVSGVRNSQSHELPHATNERLIGEPYSRSYSAGSTAGTVAITFRNFS